MAATGLGSKFTQPSLRIFSFDCARILHHRFVKQEWSISRFRRGKEDGRTRRSDAMPMMTGREGVGKKANALSLVPPYATSPTRAKKEAFFQGQ